MASGTTAMPSAASGVRRRQAACAVAWQLNMFAGIMRAAVAQERWGSVPGVGCLLAAGTGAWRQGALNRLGQGQGHWRKAATGASRDWPALRIYP